MRTRTRTRSVPLRASWMLAALAAGVGGGCLEGPPPGRGTTRMCPGEADGDPMCFQQCADAQVLDCKVKDGAGAEVPQCAHDEATGAYLFVDGAYVPPEDGTICFALLADADTSTLDPNDDLASDCEDDGKTVQVIVQGAADEVCYDVNCALGDGC